MKFTALALLAGLASAEDCEWIWEECSWMHYRDPCEGEEAETDCGWIYWDDWNLEEFWVTCDEFETWDWCDPVCDNEYTWEECSGSDYREPCDWEVSEGDCGWFYWDDVNEEDYWVSCDDFAEWEECW